MGLASLPGKLEEYVDLEREGLTAIELDVKDENGQIGFTASSLKLAQKVGATRDFYDPRAAAKLVHDRGLYLIGRIVTFEDPVLSHGRTDLGGPPKRRLGLGGFGRARLDESVRPPRVGVQRGRRDRSGEGGVRRDHVRLRAVPVRR